jgi:Immunity protein 8
MKPVIRRLHSPDIHDLENWTPEPGSEHKFGFLLQVLVGPSDGPGEESFDVVVCTPDWLHAKYPQDAVLSGRDHLIVFEYDFARLRDYIASFAESCGGSSWEDIALKLSRLGHWEFDDYQAVQADR